MPGINLTYRTKGILCGMAAAVGYGTIPLFTLPLYSAGIGANSVLFYRYAIAVVIAFFLHKVIRRKSLKISLRECLLLAGLGLLFSVSSLTLFCSFRHIDAGLACTMLFTYPIMTAVIMAAFFKEKPGMGLVAAITLATAGIALLYDGGADVRMNFAGAALVFASALSYAVYMVAIKQCKTLNAMDDGKLGFYVMLFGLCAFFANLRFGLDLQPLKSIKLWIYPTALAVFPTVLSLETLTVSIRLIGPSSAAILGALEPITAIAIGAMVFGEHITPRIISGIILVLSGVMIVSSVKKKD